MTTISLAATAAAVSICLLVRTPTDLRRLAPTPATRPHRPRAHRLVAAAAACALAILLYPPWGLLPAVVAYFVIPRLLSRLEPAATKRRRAALAADLPLTIELLAACLRAGRPPQQALSTVASAIHGPLGDLLSEIAHRLTLGADPQDAWALLHAEPPCAPVARAIDRSLTSGAPLSRTLERLAEDTRRSHHHAADEHARAVESRSALPLGLCFLPAFVLLSIIPTVADALVPYLTQP
ncbi:type II secretion system F family protein [Kribbella sp. NPDC058245]|uniref:type II secretion system F family protein n=1 Tax=Kribbella sp. NPDC058245 TaxID=3346399 RepID=UPI0036E8C8CA